MTPPSPTRTAPRPSGAITLTIHRAWTVDIEKLAGQPRRPVWSGRDETFIQLTVNGLSNGAILALAALGFVLIYKATGVINFAQGELLLIAAFVISGSCWWGRGVAVLVGVAVGRRPRRDDRAPDPPADGRRARQR